MPVTNVTHDSVFREESSTYQCMVLLEIYVIAVAYSGGGERGRLEHVPHCPTISVSS